MVKRLLECGASEPYHNYVAKIQKNMKNSDKKKRHENKLGSISEHSADADEPVDETKDDNKLDEDEEEEEDDHFEIPSNNNEINIEYNKNTPLLWAVHRGHLRVIWLLLADGYSPNDIDKMENNALHLAAAYGDVKNLQVLINCGGNAGAVNHYKNKPLDMAKNKAVREMLVVAMEAGASLTMEDRAKKHEQTLKQVF
jgi:ankyrin repeat protein